MNKLIIIAAAGMLIICWVWCLVHIFRAHSKLGNVKKPSDSIKSASHQLRAIIILFIVLIVLIILAVVGVVALAATGVLEIEAGVAAVNMGRSHTSILVYIVFGLLVLLQVFTLYEIFKAKTNWNTGKSDVGGELSGEITHQLNYAFYVNFGSLAVIVLAIVGILLYEHRGALKSKFKKGELKRKPVVVPETSESVAEEPVAEEAAAE